jgi:plastocyanin
MILGLIACLPCAPEQEASAPKQGGVRGRVSVDVEGVRLRDVLPLVVYLDAPSGRLAYPVPADVPVISQKDARFSPAFLVIAAGQTVSLANDDRIVHNVFSYSPPKRFDLGLYPTGETRKVTIEKPGVTDLFCSIHSKMNATIFVAPSPYFSQLGPSGSFEIGNVPPGKYLMKAWCRKLPESKQIVEVAPGKVSDVPIPLRGEEH